MLAEKQPEAGRERASQLVGETQGHEDGAASTVSAFIHFFLLH